MIRLSGTLICATEDEARIVAEAVPEHMRLTQAEPGCLSFTVTQTDDPLRWQVEETFTDRSAFDRHSARARASDWGRLTATLRRDYVVEQIDADTK